MSSRRVHSDYDYDHEWTIVFDGAEIVLADMMNGCYSIGADDLLWPEATSAWANYPLVF